MDAIRDDDRPELEPPILQGLGQAVRQFDPPLALRARVLESVAARTPERASPARPACGGWRRPRLSRSPLASRSTHRSSASRITDLEDELRDARARADAADIRMVDAQRTATGAQSAVAVLTAPDVARVDLAGQAVAPHASARAFWSRSRGMVFTASNLPPLPRGAHVSAVGGHRSGAAQRRPADAGRPGQRERDVQHATRHRPAGRHGRHHRTCRRSAGAHRRTVSHRNAVGELSSGPRCLWVLSAPPGRGQFRHGLLQPSDQPVPSRQSNQHRAQRQQGGQPRL